MTDVLITQVDAADSSALWPAMAADLVTHTPGQRHVREDCQDAERSGKYECDPKVLKRKDVSASH